MKPLLSVIVPVYNIESLVERSINSILAQTYTQIEIIAVDDGSTDKSLNILKKIQFRDNRLIVVHKENGGVTSARLKGLELSQGDWIGFVDGDDEIESDMYERLMGNALLYNADISHCGYQMVFPDRVDYYYNTGNKVIQNNKKGLSDLLKGSYIEPGLWNKIYKRKLFNELFENDLIDQSIKYLEDLLMNYYLFRQANVAIYEDFCSYHYTVRKNSASTSLFNEQKLTDPVVVFKKIKNETMSDEDLQLIIDGRIAWKLISLTSINTHNQKNNIRTIQSKARSELRQMIPTLITSNHSIKLKILCIWAVYFPKLYYVVHLLYSKVKGTDIKYKVFE